MVNKPDPASVPKLGQEPTMSDIFARQLQLYPQTFSLPAKASLSGKDNHALDSSDNKMSVASTVSVIPAKRG